MRLLIVEEALKDRRGHWYEYNRAIVAEAKRGAEVMVLAHRDLEPAIAAELGATPFFPATSWDGVYSSPSPLKRYLGILRHNLLVARHMERLFRTAGYFDVVLVPTVVLYHWLAWRWLAWRGRGRWFGKLVLTTRNNAGEYDPGTGGYVFNASARVLKRIVASFRGPVRRGEVELASDSSVIAAQYSALCGVPFAVYPHPVDDASPARGARANLAPITFGALGPPRFEKGSDLVLEAIRLFRAGGGDSRFVLQWTGECHDPGGNRVEPGQAICADPGVTLVTDDMTTAEYQRRLDECDVALLPYRRAQYHARLSGVAVEAFRKGIPCICFSDTWVAEAMGQYGAGIAAADETARSLADAMASMREDFAVHAERALERSQAARRYFSPASFFALLTAYRRGRAA